MSIDCQKAARCQEGGGGARPRGAEVEDSCLCE